MEKDLKKLLIMFKTEQDYAERKNQIIFVVLGILATVFANVVDKLSTIQLYVLVAAFLSIGLTVLGGFFPQGIIIKPLLYKFVKKFFKPKNNNYLNYINWKNFELTKKNDETKKAMKFFKIPINETNKNICEQLLTTSKIIFLKYFYFWLASIFIVIWTIVIILVFIFVK